MDGYEITKAVNDQLSFLSRRKYHMTEEEVERKLKEIEREPTDRKEVNLIGE